MDTPYFIFKPEILKENYKEFEDRCKKYFNKFKISYSIKTNSFKEVLKTLSDKNSGFEVASLKEIKEIPKKFTIFNGPCKTEQELKIAIKNKFLINVDSKSEINKINQILKNKPFNIGLRISLKESKFGFNEKQIKSIIKYAKSKNLNIICLHFHQGTQLNLKKYKENLKKTAKIIAKLNFRPEYIDIGGGFPDKLQLKNLNLKLEDYFYQIKKYLEKFNSTIILEPGRNLVADSMELITKIHIIKENFGKNYAILDAGINLLPRITLAPYKFSKLKKDDEDKRIKKEYILAGPLLFSNDILRRFIGNLNQGDLIKVENIGAYCYNLAWTISYKKPKIIISGYQKHNDLS
jgi:diaminopimelate decarboxylase